MKPYVELVILVSTASAIPGVIIGRRSKSILWFYCCLSFGADLLGYIFLKASLERFWISNLFVLGEWLLLSEFIISQAIPVRFRTALRYSSYFLGFLFVSRTVHFSIDIVNYADAAILFGLYVIGTLFAMFKVTQEIEFLKIERSPLFIFSAGFLLYVAGSLIILLFKTYLDKAASQLLRDLWVVHNILNILKNLAIAYCLILLNKKRVEQ